MFDEGRALLTQRNGHDSIRSYASVRQPEDWLETSGIDWNSPDAARQQLVDQYFANCSDDLKRIIIDANDKLTPRKMMMLPPGMRWESRAGVTLVGDAAHVMTPFAGVGVNLALIDTLDLANAVGRCEGDKTRLPDAIKAYEQGMLDRAEQFARKTAKGLKGHFSKDGADEFAARLNQK